MTEKRDVETAPADERVRRHLEKEAANLIIYGDNGKIVELECPCCGRKWDYNVGHKAGFVKAAAHKHVFSCWKKLIEEKTGLKIQGWTEEGYLFA